MSGITFSEFKEEFSKDGKYKALTTCKRLNDFKREYEKLNETNQQSFYDGYLQYVHKPDINKIMAMSEVHRNKALLQQNNNPVHYSNHTTKVIYVKTLAGQSMAFDFTEYLTVGSLKQNIKENKLLDCDTDYQKLFILPDTVLDDDSRTLASYGVTSETTIELFCNMKYLKPANDNFVFISNGGNLYAGMCISPDSQHIYIPRKDNVEKTEICVINTSDGSLVRTIDLSHGLNSLDLVYAVCLSPDGTSFFVTGIMGMGTVEAATVFQKRLISNEQQYTVLCPYRAEWREMCISPNGESIFIADYYKHAILVFDTSNGTSMEPIGTPFRKGTNEGDFNRPDDICMSNTGELFILDQKGTRVQVFNTNDGRFNRMFEIKCDGSVFCCTHMDVSPDGEHLYVVLNNSIHVLDASNGSLLDIIEENKHIEIRIIMDICVSPDGNFLFVLFSDMGGNRIVKYAVFGSAAYSTMGGKRNKKKGIRQKRSKNRARYSKKRGTKRKQRK